MIDITTRSMTTLYNDIQQVRAVALGTYILITQLHTKEMNSVFTSVTTVTTTTKTTELH